MSCMERSGKQDNLRHRDSGQLEVVQQVARWTGAWQLSQYRHTFIWDQVKKRGDDYEEIKQAIGHKMIEQTCKIYPQVNWYSNQDQFLHTNISDCWQDRLHGDCLSCDQQVLPGAASRGDLWTGPQHREVRGGIVCGLSRSSPHSGLTRWWWPSWGRRLMFLDFTSQDRTFSPVASLELSSQEWSLLR